MTYNAKSKTAEYGNKNNAVLQLQNAINKVSPNKLTPDSMYGDKTKGAYNSLISQGYSYNNGAFTKNGAINSNKLNTGDGLVLPDSKINNAGDNLTVAPVMPDLNNENMKTDGSKYFTDAVRYLSGESNATFEANKEFDTQTKKDKYKKLDLEATQLDQNYIDQEKKMRETNPGGTFGGALNQNLGELNYKYTSLKNNKNIEKALAMVDYNSAVDMATAKVKADYQPVKDNLDMLIKFQAFNKDNNAMTEEEKMMLQQKITQENAKYESGLQLGLYKEKAKIDNSLINSGNIFSVSSPVKAITNQDGSASLVSGYTMNAGDDPYTIAQNNGINMEELSKLNPQIKDWHNVQVGQVINLPDNSEDNNWLKSRTPVQIQAYNSLPLADRDIVKQLVSGKALMADLVKSRGAAGTKDIARYTAQAMLVDPNFSINNNKIKFVANQKWNDPNGKSFMNRSSMNTAMSHMATTYQAAINLGNTNIPKWNNIANWTSQNTGNPALTSFVYDLTVLAGEVASAYKGGNAPTDQETEKIYNSMSGSMSPSQIKGVFDNASKLMAGKLRSVAQEYKQTTGAYPEDPIIQPYTLSELKGVGIDTTMIEQILKDQGYTIPEASSHNGIKLPGSNNNTYSIGGYTINFN